MAIVGDAYVAVHAITAGFKDEVQRALDDLTPMLDSAGGRLGKGFSDNFRRSSSGAFGKIGDEAEQARQAFNRLTKAGYAAGPAIAGLVSAVGDLIVGLGGMVAAIGRAAPALAVLGGGFAALIQGAITAKLAFGGIGAAVSALNNQAGGGGGTNKAVEAAKERLQELREQLRDLKDEFAKDLYKAQVKVTKAQNALNEAYKRGAESLQQLRFQAEGAVYSEERAAIELERARETLIRAQDLPPNSRMRREAELAYKEADLNYRMAKDRAADLYTEVEAANKAGIEGTSEVISAKEDLAEAEDAVQELIDENAKRQEKIKDDIIDAQKAIKEAGVGAVSAITDAFKDLSPEAQRFAKYIASLKPVLLELKAAAGRFLFGPLEEAIQNLVDKLVPILIPILEKTGAAIGNVAVAFSKMLTSPQNLDIINRVFGEVNPIVIENLGKSFVNLADAFLKVLDAVSPLVLEFSEFLVELTGGWAETASGNVGGMRVMFEKAADAVKIIAGAIKGVWEGFSAFGKAASTMGLDLFKSLGESGKAMAEFFTPKTSADAVEMALKFHNVGENVKSIGSFIGELLKMLFELAGNPGVKAFFDAVSVIPGMFTQTGKDMAGLGGLIGDFLVQLSKVFILFMETGSIEIFFTTLTKALEFVEKAFSNDTVVQVFKYLAALKGLTLAFGTIGKVFKFFGGATIVAPFLKFFNFFKGQMPAFLLKLESGSGIIGKFLNPGGKMNLLQVFGKVGKFAGVAGAVVAVLIEMWQNSEIFRESVQNFLSGVWEALVEAFNTIKQAINEAAPAVESVSGGMDAMGQAFGVLGDIVGKYIMPVLQFLVTFLIKVLGKAIAIVIKVIAGLIQWFSTIGKVVWNVVAVVLKILGGLVDFVVGFVKIVIAILKPIWDVLFTTLKVAWEVIKAVFGVVVAFIKAWVGVVVGVYKAIWNFLYDKLKERWELVKKILTVIVDFVKGIVKKVADFLKPIWDSIYNGIKTVWNKASDFINNTLIPFIRGIPDKFSNALKGMWDFISGGLKAAWDKAKQFWNQYVAGKGFSFTIPGTDFGVNLKIPKLAMGGVVRPSPGGGGTLAMIAEAGRAERVEPLDSNGLSERDKAMIKMLSGDGGKGGTTINMTINPAPGMDEVALAKLVSRQLGFELRKGAAY